MRKLDVVFYALYALALPEAKRSSHGQLIDSVSPVVLNLNMTLLSPQTMMKALKCQNTPLPQAK